MPTRLIIGLQYLKHTFALSDEELVRRWVENPYWQYPCGEVYFRHDPPIHPTTMTRWRKRIGEEGCEWLLTETIDVDRGYRGHGVTRSRVFIAGRRRLSRRQKRALRRRSAIEPEIGHMKNDGLLRRCFLKGALGDATNVLLVGAGHNLRKPLAWLRARLPWLRVQVAITALIEALRATRAREPLPA